MADLLREIAIRQLDNVDPSKRLVIFHPNYSRQHLLLNIVSRDQSTIYVRFDGSQLTQEELRQQLNEAIAQQNGQLDSAVYVVLDEADRADPDALADFVMGLLDGTRGQVVLVTRNVPVLMQNQNPIREQTVFIPADPSLMLSNYASQDGNTALLEVRALGSGHVLLNGRRVDNWDGTLPRALFFYLVDRGMTTRAEIFETFWPNLSTREATNVFHVTKRKISEVLGVDLTVYWSGFYRIAPNIDLQYDAALFTEMLQDSAVASPEDAMRLLTYAVSLCQGDFLNSINMDWSTKRRVEMVQNYGESLIALGKLMEQAGKPEEALGLYVRASATNPQREDLARSIMLLYRQLGMFDDAIATYQRLETELENTLGVSPARNLQELLAEIESEAEGVR